MLRELVVLAVAILLPAGLSQADDPARSPAGEIARGSTSFHVIVNRANPVSDLSRAEVSAIFMKRTKSWPDRSEILPVDLPARSPLRESFSRSIHEKSSAFVGRYWQRLIFAGRGIPPPEMASDEEVIAFVTKHRGAIGYVSPAAAMSDGVKVIAVTK